MNCNRLLRHASFFVFATGIAVGPALAQADMTVYVSANGSDAYDGTAASYSTGTTGPVKTLAHARDLIRAARAGNTSTHATIYVGVGTYNFSSSLALNSQDSNLTITGATNNGTILTGSVPIAGWDHYMSPTLRRRFNPNVIKKLFSSATSANLGDLQHGGNFDLTNAQAELILGGAPMQLVRFPATGYMNVTSVDSSGQNITTDQSRRIASANDAWMVGFFNNNTYSPTVKVIAAPGTSQYTLTPTTEGDEIPVVGSRVAILNQPEDLVSPGQYYIDRSAGRVYFYPPAASDTLLNTSASISSLDAPVIDANGASQIQLNSLVVQGSRAQGIRFINCTNSAVGSSVVRSVLQEGIVIRGGSNISVSGSEIVDTGSQGVYVNSGDMTTLTSGSVTVTGNLIHRTGRILPTYSQGVYLAGVGNTISNNTFQEIPANAIGFEGALQLIQSNDISDVMKQISDGGAIYGGRRITDRGDRIDSNIIHDIAAAPYGNGQVGIYLDDYESGVTVTNNILSNLPFGVLIGGGQNNTVQGNAFNQVPTPIQMDARGAVGFMMQWFAPGGGYSVELAAMTPSQLSLFQSRFPDFAAMYSSSNPGLPVNNNISGNYFPTSLATISFLDAICVQLTTVSNNATDGNILFVNPGAGNFTLNPGVANGPGAPTTPTTAGAGTVGTAGASAS